MPVNDGARRRRLASLRDATRSSALETVVPGLPGVPVAVAIMAGAALIALLIIGVNALVTGVFLAVEVAALAVDFWLGFAEPVRPAAEAVPQPSMLGRVGRSSQRTPPRSCQRAAAYRIDRPAKGAHLC